jgi:DNA-binding MurR/RpiR family transcriptional regulator
MAASHSSVQRANASYPDLLGEIKSTLHSLHAAEVAIAQAVLDDPAVVASMNISQLAEYSETSVATVVRFSKVFGFRGFPEFRMALVAAVTRLSQSGVTFEDLDSGITVNDSPEELIKKIAQSDAMAIQATAERLDTKSFVAAVDLWQKAGTIGIIGLASSGYVAMDLQLKLNRQGKNAIAWRDVHTAFTSLSVLKKGDVLVAISHSGTTLEIVDAIKEFKSRGIKIVLITNGLRSTAAELADIVLYTSARETTFRSGATASRIAQLTVVDCLCVALAQRNWSSTKSALDTSRAAIGGRSGKTPKSRRK